MKNLDIVKYKGTGNLYQILSLDCKMKNPITREWEECVIYQSLMDLCPDDGGYKENTSHGIWVRGKNEFNLKFEVWN